VPKNLTGETLTNVILAVCAVVAVVTTFRRAEGSRRVEAAPASSRELSRSEWDTALRLARVVDSPNTSELLVFLDVECPYCARYDESLAHLRRTTGTALTIAYLPFPLSQHRFAMQGALATECLRATGRVEGFLGAVMQRQDSIGLIDWADFAQRAAIDPPSGFADCISRETHRAVVDSAIAFGRTIGVAGTPAVLLNGTLYNRPPSEAEVRDLIRPHRAVRR